MCSLFLGTRQWPVECWFLGQGKPGVPGVSGKRPALAYPGGAWEEAWRKGSCRRKFCGGIPGETRKLLLCILQTRKEEKNRKVALGVQMALFFPWEL